MAFSSYFEATPPMRKRESIDSDEVPILIFRPFGGAPKVFFKNVFIGEKVSRSLLLRNPQTETLEVELVKLPSAEAGITFSCKKWQLNPYQESTLQIIWQPKREGKSIHSVQLKTNANARFHFSIVCVSVPKKAVKKRGKVTQITASTSQRVILKGNGSQISTKRDISIVKRTSVCRESPITRSKLSSTENTSIYSSSKVKHTKSLPGRGTSKSSTIYNSTHVKSEIKDLLVPEDVMNCSSETYDVISPGRNLSVDLSEDIVISTGIHPSAQSIKKEVNFIDDFVFSPINPTSFQPRQGVSRETFTLSTPFAHIPKNEVAPQSSVKPRMKNVQSVNLDRISDDSLSESPPKIAQINQHTPSKTPLAEPLFKQPASSTICDDSLNFLNFKFSPIKANTDRFDASCMSELEEGLDNRQHYNKSTFEMSIPSFTPLQISKHGGLSETAEKSVKGTRNSEKEFCIERNVSDMPTPQISFQNFEVTPVINANNYNLNTATVKTSTFEEPVERSKTIIGKCSTAKRDLLPEMDDTIDGCNLKSNVQISAHDCKITPVNVENFNTTTVNTRTLEEQIARSETFIEKCSTTKRDLLLQMMDGNVDGNNFKSNAHDTSCEKKNKTNITIQEISSSRKVQDFPMASTCLKESSIESIPTAIETNYLAFSPPRKQHCSSKENELHRIPKIIATKTLRKPLTENVPIINKDSSNQVKSKVKLKKEVHYAIPSLVLSRKKKTQEKSVTLMDTDKILAEHANPSYCISAIIVNPFINSAVFYDQQWFDEREKEFVRWLNVLLTPPEQLTSSDELPKVDVAALWKKCCNSEVAPAPSREAVSSRYLVNHRLDSVRRKACAMFRLPAVAQVLSKVIVQIEKGILSVRKDRNITRDIGLKTGAIELLLCYNPLWLRIGLETVMGRTIPLESNSDRVGMIGFIGRNILSDPYLVERYAYSGVTNMFKPGFEEAMKKHILKKFFLLVFFLDYAKENKLIFHNPCLFCKNAQYKESRDLLLAFARDFLSGVGDITKHLRSLGYVVKHKQTYLDEFNYAVRHLGSDLRDGVRLAKVTEIILQESSLSPCLRTPAVSKLQKIHNVKVALSALSKAGHVVEGNITTKDLVEGHREKTMSLLWQIIYKFQLTRFTSSANKIQKWYRSLYITISRRIWLRKELMRKRAIEIKACTVIQRHWRGYIARRYYKACISSVYKIQKWYKSVRMIKEDRTEYLRKRNAVIRIQRYVRNVLKWKESVKLEKQRTAVSKISMWYYNIKLAREHKYHYKKMKVAAVYIQQWFRSVCVVKHLRHELVLKRKSALYIQRWYRSNLIARAQRQHHLKQKKAIVVIQKYFRQIILIRKLRSRYILQKQSAIYIQRWYRAYITMRKQRKEYLKLRDATCRIQLHFRAIRIVRREMESFARIRNAVLKIQTWFRSIIVMRLQRKDYLVICDSAIKIQTWYRATKLMREERKLYLLQHTSARIIQERFRASKLGRQQKQYYKLQRHSVTLIQYWYRNVRIMRTQRQHFLMQRNAAITIQRHGKAWILAKQQRYVYLLKKNAVLKIESWYRACLSMRSQRIYYIKQQIAVLNIQRYFKSRRLMRKNKTLYEEKKIKTIKIQQWFRSVILMQQEREKFLKIRKCTIKIQTWYRGVICMRKQRNLYLRQRNAALKIQQKYRALRMSCKQKHFYYLQKKSAIVIQKWFRNLLITRKQRQLYLEMRNEARHTNEIQCCAAVKIQCWFRSCISVRSQNIERLESRINFRTTRLFPYGGEDYDSVIEGFTSMCNENDFVDLTVARQKEAVKRIEVWYKSVLQKREEAKIRKNIEIEQEHATREKCITKIQAFWRGYKTRRALKISNILPKFEPSKKYTLNEGISLRAHYEKSLKTFLPSSSYTMLLGAGILIESCVRLSPEICEDFLLSPHLDTLVFLLSTMNRSVPAESLMSVLLKILTHVLRHNYGVWRVLENKKTVPVLVDLTNIWCTKRTEETFCYLCTVWWLLGQDKESVKTLKTTANVNVQLLKCYAKVCTWNTRSLKCSSTPMKGRLPNLNPSWSSRRSDRPRVFENGKFAIVEVLRKLHIERKSAG